MLNHKIWFSKVEIQIFTVNWTTNIVLLHGDPWIPWLEIQTKTILTVRMYVWISIQGIHESPQWRTKIITTLKVRMYRQTLLYIYILTFRVVIILVLLCGDSWISIMENQIISTIVYTFSLLGLWLFWFSFVEIHGSPSWRTKIIPTLKVRMYIKRRVCLYILTFRVDRKSVV